MNDTRLIMGMPVTVEVLDAGVSVTDVERIFTYFAYIDDTFSTYKRHSEISRINAGEIQPADYSADMKTILKLSERTRRDTNGYFDISHNGMLDPSGIVKGWAVRNAAGILRKHGYRRFYVEAGGDIQVSGTNRHGNKWRIGIRHPFMKSKIIKTVCLDSQGIATSGTYERGNHIYIPEGCAYGDAIVSLTVIAGNVYDADRYATAAFAMGRNGIGFIEKTPGCDGYMVDVGGQATYTPGFDRYLDKP